MSNNIKTMNKEELACLSYKNLLLEQSNAISNYFLNRVSPSDGVKYLTAIIHEIAIRLEAGERAVEAMGKLLKDREQALLRSELLELLNLTLDKWDKDQRGEK